MQGWFTLVRVSTLFGFRAMKLSYRYSVVSMRLCDIRLCALFGYLYVVVVALYSVVNRPILSLRTTEKLPGSNL